MNDTTSKTTHTPGPWYFFTNRHETTEGERWGTVAHKPHPAMGAPFPLPGVTVTWHGQQGEATARLIAAAPELLEALTQSSLDPGQTALDWLSAFLRDFKYIHYDIEKDPDPPATNECLQILWALVADGRAAIAKARGEVAQ